MFNLKLLALMFILSYLTQSVLLIKILEESKKNFKSSAVNESVSASINEVSNDKRPHWTNPRGMIKILHAEPAGNTVTFQCKADGEKPLNTTWFKDGKKVIKGERIGEYKFRRKRQVLVLSAVVLTDAGHFRCVVSNRFGSINHTYELDVIERSASKPIIVGGILTNQTVEVGTNVTFRCEVFSDTHPHVEWLKIPPDNRTYIVLKRSDENAMVNNVEELVLRNVSFEDAGEYSCIAGNAIGISHVSAWLTVNPPSVAIEKSASDDHGLIFVLFASLFTGFFVLAALGCIFRARMCRRAAPQLVSIKDPGKIPHLTRLEEPLLMPGFHNRGWGMKSDLPRVEVDLQWEIKRETVSLVEALGEGFFGLVYKADLVSGSDKQEVAVKMLKPSSSDRDVMDLISEMEQMKRVGRHKNIINLVGVCTQNGPLWLVTEFAEQGNLRDYLRRNRPAEMQYHITEPCSQSKPLSAKTLVSAAYQVARGMEYLSQKKCVHRDVAARNVLVTDDYVMKIADFGLARDVHAHDYYRKNTRGHLPYKWMALEAMTDNVFTHATDVWSFGILMWEIFSLGASPYPGVKTHELVRLLRQGERLDHPQFASLEIYRLMRDCWEENPQGRPHFRQLVEDLDRLLATASSLDYIDLTLPLTSEYASSESGIADEGGSSPCSPTPTSDDNDSVFNSVGHVTALSNEGNPLLFDDVIGPAHF